MQIMEFFFKLRALQLIFKIYNDMYPQEMVNPMQAELTAAGFQDLHSAEAVENAMKLEGTTLVVVNSVCGCAARNARPGAKMSLEQKTRSFTVLQELIKMRLMLQDNTCSLFLHHHPAMAFVQKRRISTC
jgi:putative YphP/YqiW family bacilliredoxin